MAALGDALAAAAGHDVNRPGLNAFIDQSQARNGLVSQQTEEAMLNAQKMRDQMDAASHVEDAMTDITGDPKFGRLAGLHARMNPTGNWEDLIKSANAARLSNPDNLTTPIGTASQAGFQGKLPEPVSVPNIYTTLPGAAPVNPQMTQQGQAQLADTQSQTQQRAALAHQALVKANTAGAAPDEDALNFGAYQYFKSGNMPALGMGSGPARLEIMKRAGQMAQQEQMNPGSTMNPAYEMALQNHQDYVGSQRALNSFASGPLSNQTRAINNSVGHLSLIENLWTAVNNGDLQAINKLSNAWEKMTGSHAPTDVQTAATVLGPELAKVMANNGGAGTGEERQEFGQLVGNLANAPEQATGAIQTLKGMLGRQAADLALQYHGATGRSDFSNRYLAGDTRKYLDLDPETGQVVAAPTQTPSASALGNAPAAPVKIQSDADYNQLPSGALFIAPDGKTRRKP